VFGLVLAVCIGWARCGEPLLYTQGVTGSNPVPPIFRSPLGSCDCSQTGFLCPDPRTLSLSLSGQSSGQSMASMALGCLRGGGVRGTKVSAVLSATSLMPWTIARTWPRLRSLACRTTGSAWGSVERPAIEPPQLLAQRKFFGGFCH
jgi:hypothetical protein